MRDQEVAILYETTIKRHIAPNFDPHQPSLNPGVIHMLNLAVRRQHAARNPACIMRGKAFWVIYGDIVPILDKRVGTHQAHNARTKNGYSLWFFAHYPLTLPPAALSASGVKGLSHQFSNDIENGPLADAVKLIEI